MAQDLNRATLIGRATKDPETRTTPSGSSVTSFSVATNHTWKDQSGEKKESVQYTDIVVWGKLGEICAQYVTKGKKLYVEGRIQTRQWEGQDGLKRSRTEIVAENVILLDRGDQREEVRVSEIPF